MSTLPIEIIRQIVEDIVDDINDLTYHDHMPAVSLSCRLLRHEAQRVLFRDPALYTRSPPYKKTLMFLDTVISSPDRLALYVKTLKIDYRNWWHPNTEDFVKKLSSALQAMHLLKSLDVDNQLNSILSLASILEGVQFKLTSFRWAGPPDGVSDAATIKTDFLRHQDEIEHLAMSSFIAENTLEPIAVDMCPRLRSLSGPYSITQLILPNKKHLTSLQWTLFLGNRSILESFQESFHVESISDELANVRCLSYEDCNIGSLPFAPLLRDVALYLRSLICLEIERGDIQVEALSQLPQLKVLVLLEDGRTDIPEPDVVVHVATVCNFLERVDIQDDSGILSYRFDRLTNPPQAHIEHLEDSQMVWWTDRFDKFDSYIW